MEGHIKVIVSFNEELNSTLLVQVEDTGVGIAKEDLNKIFMRFCKLKRTAQMNSEGLGLGLTIVK